MHKLKITFHIIRITFILASHYPCILTTAAAQKIDYEHIIQENPPLSLHLATVDPKRVKIILEPTESFGIAEKTSAIAQRKNATLAINGGFFDFGHNQAIDFLMRCLDALGFSHAAAYPLQAMKIDDQWFSLSPREAGFIGWNECGKEVFDTQQNSWQLVVNDTHFPVAALNRPYASGPILYTPLYAQKTPQSPDRIEVIVENDMIVDRRGGGGTQIPANGYVYALNIYHEHISKLDHHTIGLSAKVIKECDVNSCKSFESLKYVLGSTPLLIKDGVIQSSVYRSSPFYTKKHPRTALCILSNGLWLFLVVDGRQASSEGMSLPSLADFLKNRGCTSALNLDGGGSSTMVLNNKVVNSPSGREWGLFSGLEAERRVANAILVLL